MLLDAIEPDELSTTVETIGGQLATRAPRWHAAPMSDTNAGHPSQRVQRTDYVSLPVQDMQRAKVFYRDTLGLHSPDWNANWPEIETGNVSLYLVEPPVMGTAFSPHVAPLALRVADVASARQEYEGRGGALHRRARQRRVSHGVLLRQ